MIENVLWAGATAIVLVALTLLYRVVRGPTMQDRVLAVNVIGSNIVVVLALIAAATEDTGVLDIALVYALLNFLMSIAVSKFTVERGGVL